MEREQLEMDVVFVGAGPANLAAALYLKRIIAENDAEIAAGYWQGKPVGEIEIGVVEKGASVGAHILSGAVMDAKALEELMPDFLEQGFPFDTKVEDDAFWYLTERGKFQSPITPPPLKNHGYYIVSLSRVCEWLGEKCEEAGINIFPEFPAAEVLYDENDRVIGIRTGDKGIDKEGRPKPNFEPGVDILAKVTVLGEGSRGSLTKQLTARLGLDNDKEPPVFSLGIKELWELPAGNFAAGRVIHTLGFPSDAKTYG
ncbi:MAG: NAD(P)/FAD-dependent oxidoreductase, partial [Pyrinomonadaceae bacterium]